MTVNQKSKNTVGVSLQHSTEAGRSATPPSWHTNNAQHMQGVAILHTRTRVHIERDRMSVYIYRIAQYGRDPAHARSVRTKAHAF